MQLHPVSHRDHHVALHVVEAIGCACERGWRLLSYRGARRRRPQRRVSLGQRPPAMG